MSVASIWTPGILGRLLFRLLLLVVVLACGRESGVADTTAPGGQRIIHESWTFKDGAPEAVAALAQTADGYLWLGTEFELFRFDGIRFERFLSPVGDQLMSTNIATLFADSTGGLWVGYLFGGVSFVKNGKVKNFPETVAPTKSLLGFAEDRHGVVWSATGTGLWRFDGSAWQAIRKDWNAPAGLIYQVGFDRDGILWALAGWSDTGRQLFYLLPESKQFQNAGENLAAKFTWDADHKVLTSYEPGSNEPGFGINLDHSLPAYPLLRKDSGQIVDRANGIWIMPLVSPFLMHHATGGSLTETLRNLSPQTSEVYDVNPNHFAFLVDREGAVWFGDSKGLHRFSYSPLLNQEFPKAAPNFALAADEAGAVWVVAGDYNATTVYRVADGKATEKSHENLQNFAYRASDGSLWFGGKAGLWHVVDGRFNKIELPPDVAHNPFGPRAITQDGSGGLWVSFSGNVLYRFADGTWTLNGGRQDLPPQLIMTEFTDSLGRVWFGSTRSRLTVLDGGRLLTFGPDDGVRVGNVTAIYGRGSEVWIGGEFGLQQFDHGRFHNTEAVENEWLRGISGIVETANGDLWLNSVGGIVHIRRAEILEALKNPHFKVAGERLGRREGLPGLPSQIWPLLTAVEGTDGRIWFTVHNGVVWLDPNRASNKVPPPPVTIESVSADDKGFGIDLPIQLPAHTSNVQISYAAISLMDPEAIRYRYKLRETDKDWHEAATSTSVSYRNLPPGSYHFLVNASDANGGWSDNSATAEFTILPAYYQTNWFRALCAVFFMALLWAGYQWRLQQLRHQFEMTLDARVGERTRIARELHDTLLQSFHGLLLRFQTVSQLLPDRPMEAREKLGSAIEQAAEAITEGRDAVQGLRDSTTQTNDLARAISTLGEELAADSTGHCPAFRVAVEGESRDLHPILRDEVYKIAAEALRNAFLHANAKQVEVEIRYDNERFRLRDDGKGIDAAVLSAQSREGHYGLPGMRERATLLGGKLTIWSEVDAGTEVELRVPANIAYVSPQRDSWFSRKFAAKAKE
jgi:signal transduction histidine kinase/ligand-binding sensor domain-containing protein